MSQERLEKLESAFNLTVKRLIMSSARVKTLDPSLITVKRMIMSRKGNTGIVFSPYRKKVDNVKG